MRRILVESARARRSRKRGGGRHVITLDEATQVSAQSGPELVALDDDVAGGRRRAEERVVELRFFGGLTLDETAAVLDVSRDTVKRDWRMAKVWLLREIDRAST
jgi:RNA polymerase sigma-70 factor, ECF subfamily